MNIGFVGGGSYEILPNACGVLQNPEVLDHSEIRLVDFNLLRVETVDKMIMRTREVFQNGANFKFSHVWWHYRPVLSGR